MLQVDTDGTVLVRLSVRAVVRAASPPPLRSWSTPTMPPLLAAAAEFSAGDQVWYALPGGGNLIAFVVDASPRRQGSAAAGLLIRTVHDGRERLVAVDCLTPVARTEERPSTRDSSTRVSSTRDSSTRDSSTRVSSTRDGVSRPDGAAAAAAATAGGEEAAGDSRSVGLGPSTSQLSEYIISKSRVSTAAGESETTEAQTPLPVRASRRKVRRAVEAAAYLMVMRQG